MPEDFVKINREDFNTILKIVGICLEHVTCDIADDDLYSEMVDLQNDLRDISSKITGKD